MPLFHLKGVHTPHRKHTADAVPVRMQPPASVIIPMSMHIGAPATPIVKIGDEVKIGQKIAEGGGFVSSPIHASISGKVKKIEDFRLSNGRAVPAILIENDNQNQISETVLPPVIDSLDDFVNAVRESGIVGLGGAGFPTSVKLAVKDLSKIEAVIINGAECEPYITSDTRTMLDQADLIAEGIALLEKYLQVKQIIIGIEKNKPACIAEMRKLAQNDSRVRVQALPSLYPQGGEKVLIYHTIGKMVPEGKLPLDVGAVVINCTTLASIARYIKTGMPLVEKVLTVDGSAVSEPKNVIAPIGTRMEDVFAFCGGFSEEPEKVLYGGPMMGIAVPDLSQPILKNTNAVLAFAHKDAVTAEPTACIRCGNCISHCPLQLNPPAIAKAFKAKDMESLARFKVNLCMECGCCSFICPAKRPIVQNHKLAKAALAEYLKKKKESESK